MNSIFPGTISIIHQLEKHAQITPNKTVFTYLHGFNKDENSISYLELSQRVKAVANKLKFLGATGENVLLLYPHGLDYIIAFFGCLYAEAIAVPAYPPRNKRHLPRIQSIAKDANTKIVLTSSQILPDLQCLSDACSPNLEIEWIVTDDLPLIPIESWKVPEIDGDSLALLQYTSGSTGDPKGVMISHANIMHNQEIIKTACQHSDQTNYVNWLPLYHDMGLFFLIQTIYIGAQCTLLSPMSFLQRPILWLEAISKYQAHTSGGPNFAYELCINKIDPATCSSLDLSCWEIAFIGAEPIQKDTLKRFFSAFSAIGFKYRAFYPRYGLAESTVAVTGGLKKKDPNFLHVQDSALEQNQVVELTPGSGTEKSRSIVSCGQTWLNHELIIVDHQTSIRCKANEIGEIWLAGTSVGRGYWNKPDESANTFQAYLADTGKGPYLRTGDLGFISKGELYVTGQLKDLIILRGRNIYPNYIENCALAVDQSGSKILNAAFSIPGETDENVILLQEVKFRRIKNLDKLIHDIKQVVLEEFDIRLYAILLLKPGTLPKTTSGKIQRGLCRRKYLQNQFRALKEWRRTVASNDCINHKLT